MGANKETSIIVENLQKLLEDSGSLTEAQIDLVVHLVADSYKKGYKIGVSRTVEQVHEAVLEIRDEVICSLEENGLEDVKDNQACNAAWAVCDTLEVFIASRVTKLVKEETH